MEELFNEEALNEFQILATKIRTQLQKMNDTLLELNPEMKAMRHEEIKPAPFFFALTSALDTIKQSAERMTVIVDGVKQNYE